MTDIRETREWQEDCRKWRGVVLRGAKSHWCYDWDFLPVDETTPEFTCCTCYDRSSEDKTHGVQ